jgi:sulfatase maturation enzyme AslB (radical SAM superfamily)
MDKYVLGHVTTGIDQAAFADYLRGYFSTKHKCETCWAVNLCGGYCPWYVSGNDGAFAEPEEWWCEEIRQWYEMGIWMYDTLRSDYPDYWRQLVGEESPEPLLR